MYIYYVYLHIDNLIIINNIFAQKKLMQTIFWDALLEYIYMISIESIDTI